EFDTVPVPLPRLNVQAAPGIIIRPSESGQVTVHGDTVWATAQGVEWPQTVVAFDARTLQQRYDVHVDEITRQIGDIESGPGGAWMENRIEGANSGKAALIPISPGNGKVTYVSQGNYLQQGVAVQRTAVWFAGGVGTTVARLDP